MSRPIPWGSAEKWLVRSVVPALALALGACAAEGPVNVTDLGPSFALTADGSGLMLCKYTPEPTTQTFDFRVTAAGGVIAGDGRFTLSSTQTVDVNPECAEVWAPDGTDNTVTIEELTPVGWELFAVYHNQRGFIDPPRTGPPSSL